MGKLHIYWDSSGKILYQLFRCANFDKIISFSVDINLINISFNVDIYLINISFSVDIYLINISLSVDIYLINISFIVDIYLTIISFSVDIYLINTSLSVDIYLIKIGNLFNQNRTIQTVIITYRNETQKHQFPWTRPHISPRTILKL